MLSPTPPRLTVSVTGMWKVESSIASLSSSGGRRRVEFLPECEAEGRCNIYTNALLKVGMLMVRTCSAQDGRAVVAPVK